MRVIILIKMVVVVLVVLVVVVVFSIKNIILAIMMILPDIIKTVLKYRWCDEYQKKEFSSGTSSNGGGLNTNSSNIILVSDTPLTRILLL